MQKRSIRFIRMDISDREMEGYFPMNRTQIMTDKDREMYNVISLYIAQNGFSPTVRELCAMTGARSTSTVHSRLKKLENLGKIRKLTESPRTITVV